MRSLKTAIDYSYSSEVEPKYIFALVSVENSNVPELSDILINKLRIKHWTKLRKKEKTIYVNKFLRRWEEIKNILYKIDVEFYFEKLLDRNRHIIEESKELIIDNNVFSKYLGIYESKGKLILEGYAKGFEKALIDLADNIANIVRWLWNKEKDNWKKYEILKEFRK